MSKAKKSQPSTGLSGFRNFRLLHQSLSITEINFKKQTILGTTELTVSALPSSTSKLWKVYLNCKQCRILKITVNDTLKANYSYMDPTMRVCPPESKKRSLEFFDACHHTMIKSCDSDCNSNAGELIIKIPRDAYSAAGPELHPLKIKISYSLEQPKGGVMFVVPPGGTSETMRHAHVYSYGSANSSRLWFPCVDSYSEPCPWDISFTVPASMTAVGCGELVDTVLSSDGKKKVFNYSLSIPTAAPCIGFAIGCFEIYPDPVMQEVTHFCLPSLLPILKNTVQVVNQVFGFYEELLSARFPHSSYKLVFVDCLYEDVCNYSTLGLFSTNLLHSSRVIDQVMSTRRIVSKAVAMQYFGCYVLQQTWNDWWICAGIAGYLTGLFCRKAFGHTEYTYWITTEQRKVCDYEAEHTLPPLCASLSPCTLTDSTPSGSGSRVNLHPKLLSGQELEVLFAKAHLVIRMIQLKIGQDLLLQVFNKILTLASSASQSSDYGSRSNLMVSTESFMKLLVTVSGKDMSQFMDQWVCNCGVPRLLASYSFVRKKNFVELKLRQETTTKFVGSMSVIVQEFDGCFTHNIQVEDLISTHELPCHSKIRKAKKRKVPLIHGEEIDIDISNMDNEVPILWVRVDPDYQWIRQLTTEQADTTWQNVLKYERDAIAQLNALEALLKYPSVLSRDSFRDALLNPLFYYHVRLEAANSLARYLTDTASTGSTPSFLISLYQRLFGSSSQQSMVRFHDFSDIPSYLLQKGLAHSIASMRTMHKQCPKEVFTFVMDLFKYSDNQKNKYSDDHFVSALIDALAETITPKVSVSLPAGYNFSKTPTAGLAREMQVVLQEIVQHLNIEKVLPSYRYCVTCSCLRCLRQLQKNGHLPSDSSLFKEYNGKGNFIDVRVTAIKAIVDIVQADQSESDLDYLLQLVETEEPRIRLEVLSALSTKPPFTRRVESKLNNLPFVERLYTMMNSDFYFDSRLRCATMQLYGSMFGRLTPSCVPQGLGVVIDLKEKVARANLASPITTPRSLPELKPSFTPTAAPVLEEASALKVSTLASGGVDSSPPSSPINIESPPEAQIPLLRVTVLDQNSPPASSKPASQPPLSLKISTSHLKRLSPSLGLEDSRSLSTSPESSFSASVYSPAEMTDSPSHQHRHKRHKTEHKEHKHKHKKKKSKKTKHKHGKHSSHDIDVETV